MSIRYELTDDIGELLKRVTRINDKAESALNEILHNFGVDETVDNITNLIPVSAVSKTNHAKFSTWYTKIKANLGFEIIARGKGSKLTSNFGYLVFPDKGLGRNNPLEQRFMERGMEISKPKITDKLTDKLKSLLEG